MDLGRLLGVGGEEVLAGRPDGEDERQPRPLLPHLPQVVDLEPEAGRVVQVGAERGVADQHGGVRLLHHQPQVGRAGVVVGPDPVPLGEQELREAYRGAGGRAEGHPGPVELLQWDLGDDHAGHDGPVAADRDVGEGHQVVGVAQVLHEGDRTDVQVPPDELLAEALRGVLGELQVEQGSRARQAPVERQAVQELDVADAGPAATVLVAFTGGDG